MSTDLVLSAETRRDVGKGASRRLRRDGKVPGVIYGAQQDPLSLTLNHNEVMHELDNEAFYSSVLNIKIDGRSERAILRDLQRHPYKPGVLHIDFLRVRDDVALTINVPLHFLNEENCVGVKQEGGILSRNLTDLEVSCLPKDLPEYIELDVGGLSIGDSIHLSDLKLPEGVTLVQHVDAGEEAPDVTVVSVLPPQLEPVESDEEPAAAEDAEPEADSEGESEGDDEAAAG